MQNEPGHVHCLLGCQFSTLSRARWTWIHGLGSEGHDAASGAAFLPTFARLALPWALAALAALATLATFWMDGTIADVLPPALTCTMLRPAASFWSFFPFPVAIGEGRSAEENWCQPHLTLHPVAIACGSSHGATGRGTFVRSTRVQVVLRGGVLVGAHPIGNERANRQGIAPSPRRRRRPVC